MPTQEGALVGVSGQLKGIAKHRIWVLSKTVSCAQNRWTNLNNLHITLRLFCTRGCLLRVAMIAPVLEISVALTFLIATNSVMS